MDIYLDWIRFEFSLGERDILVVGKDEHDYYLVAYEYEDEGIVTVWQEYHDFNDNIVDTYTNPPENINLYYRQIIKNLLEGAIL